MLTAINVLGARESGWVQVVTTVLKFVPLARDRSAVAGARSLRIFRCEIRRWREGVIPDVDEAVDSPQRLTDNPVVAQRVLDLVPDVPMPVWGRDELQAGEMWNSNSLISWLIARSGLDVDAVHPPFGGRAPGWQAGVVVAGRQQTRVAPPAWRVHQPPAHVGGA